MEESSQSKNKEADFRVSVTITNTIISTESYCNYFIHCLSMNSSTFLSVSLSVFVHVL